MESANAKCRLCSMRLALLSDTQREQLEGCDHVHFMVYNEKEVAFGEGEGENVGRNEPFSIVKGIDFEHCPVDGKGEWKVQSALQTHDLEGLSMLESALGPFSSSPS
jgi:hypothetical protein